MQGWSVPPKILARHLFQSGSRTSTHLNPPQTPLEQAAALSMLSKYLRARRERPQYFATSHPRLARSHILENIWISVFCHPDLARFHNLKCFGKYAPAIRDYPMWRHPLHIGKHCRWPPLCFYSIILLICKKIYNQCCLIQGHTCHRDCHSSSTQATIYFLICTPNNNIIDRHYSASLILWMRRQHFSSSFSPSALNTWFLLLYFVTKKMG